MIIFFGLVVIAIIWSFFSWPAVARALIAASQEWNRVTLEQRQSQLAAMKADLDTRKADLAAMREEFRSIESRTSWDQN